MGRDSTAKKNVQVVMMSDEESGEFSEDEYKQYLDEEVKSASEDGSQLPSHLKNNTLVLLMGKAFTNLILRRINEFQLNDQEEDDSNNESKEDHKYNDEEDGTPQVKRTYTKKEK
jgi:hypothetical protein